MAMINSASDGYYHPANEKEIRNLILYANKEQLKIRVRGSAHSVPAAIYTGDSEDLLADGRNINIMLDKMVELRFDLDKLQVTAQAGCHLGMDPADPTKSSTIENSLCYQIDRLGWALCDTGGILHQTVSGFISTASCGGSLEWAVDEQIIGVRLIDGTGKTHELLKSDDPNNPFYAAGVSMGLLGIITAITFQCEKKYNIAGRESITKVGKCMIDLFGSGSQDRRSLKEFLTETPYARLLWWPQSGVNKMVIWQAQRMTQNEPFIRKPYQLFPKIFGSTNPAQIFAGLFFRSIRHWNSRGLRGKLTRILLKLKLAAVINLFQPEDGKNGPQKFADSWWQGLPMDNSTSDKWLPTEFTELWIPIEMTQQVMVKLRDHFEKNGLSAIGIFAWEIYAAKPSQFWMSPGYNRASLRIDPFWIANSKGNPAEDFFPQLWSLLKTFDFRLHWGKHLPYETSAPNKWVEYIKKQYPKWERFMMLRSEMDPGQIFMTEYWRSRLGIEPN